MTFEDEMNTENLTAVLANDTFHLIELIQEWTAAMDDAGKNRFYQRKVRVALREIARRYDIPVSGQD